MLGVAAVFVFGVVVGRTSAGPGRTDSLPNSSQTTAAPPASTAAPTTTAGSAPPRGQEPTPRAGRTPTTGSASTLLNPAFVAAIVLPLPGRPAVQSIAEVGNQLVVLAPGWLARISEHTDGGLYWSGSVGVGLPVGDPTYAHWDLVSDGKALWALTQDPSLRLYPVNPSSLTLGPMIQPPAGVVDVAALDGHLYLNTDVGVFDAAPSAQPSAELPIVARGGRSMAADPSRHRLLLLNDDDGWSISAYTPPADTVAASRSLPFNAHTVAVADGAIWVTGSRSDTDRHPVLARLDPATLKIAAHSSLEESLTSTPTIVAHGKYLWIRSTERPDELWCVNAHSGAIAGSWPDLPGIVAAQSGQAFVADWNVVGQLSPDSCAP